MKELASLSEKIMLKVYDVTSDVSQAKGYGIERTPATVVLEKDDYGIRFYGPNAGHEFTSLVESILVVSMEVSGLDPQLEKLVKEIKAQV